MQRIIMPAQISTQNLGELKVNITAQDNASPIPEATVRITDPDNPDNVIEELSTDESGQTETIELPTPPIDYSLTATSTQQPYGEYNIEVNAPGYERFVVSNSQILAQTTAIQDVRLVLASTIQSGDVVVPPHTLYGYYPPKIAEDEVKDVQQSGEIVLSQVVIPETIIVHAGPPTDATARNYYVKFKDYIKNVASSEIYDTWPESTIIANVLAILSFTLNRVYTEWYRNKGYDFTITSSTAYDHFFVYGRNIFSNIANVVDNIFTNYLSRPNVRQPILTQYCDGQRVQCPNWMRQWGSKDLGEQGYTPIEILRYYYGDNMFINTAQQVSGIPSSWPGADLNIGSRGTKVRQIQEQLNRISQSYPAIPSVTADGVYGEGTRDAVRDFQRVFGLPVSGIVDYPTWYKISEIYVGVSRIAELV